MHFVRRPKLNNKRSDVVFRMFEPVVDPQRERARGSGEAGGLENGIFPDGLDELVAWWPGQL